MVLFFPNRVYRAMLHEVQKGYTSVLVKGNNMQSKTPLSPLNGLKSNLYNILDIYCNCAPCFYFFQKGSVGTMLDKGPKEGYATSLV